jgi:hypothetical protein
MISEWRLPSCARLEPIGFPLGCARGFGKTGQARECGRPYADNAGSILSSSLAHQMPMSSGCSRR